MNHTQIVLQITDTDLQDILIAQLAEIDYDGFEQDETTVKAYIEETLYNESALFELLNDYNISFEKNIILKQNWNEVWESNFQPVFVDDFVGVRASFHQPIKNTEHEIVITPKMSFGTGHHATTYTVMQLMREVDFKNKSVFDFGSGTGILAILAEKLGAVNILAVDHDDWCIENSIENIQQNNCTHITVTKADHATTAQTFDIVIANINKNIIQDNFELIHKACKPNGTVILSGLLIEDEIDILTLAESKKWRHITTRNKGAWIAILFEL